MRHGIEITLVLHVKLGHEPVAHFDPSLGKIARGTKILQPLAAGNTMRLAAGAPHRGHNQVTWFDAANFAPDLYHFPERFVTYQEIFVSIGRRAINEVANLFISATKSDFEGADFNIMIGGYTRNRMFHDPDLPSLGQNS